MAITPISSTVLSLLGDEPAASTGICAWIATKLRTVEQLSQDWENKGAEGSNITWTTILKDIAKIFIGIVSAAMVSIPTLGTALPCLINETRKQTQLDMHKKARAALQQQTSEHTKANNSLANDAAAAALSKENADLKARIDSAAEKEGILTKAKEELQTAFDTLQSKYDNLKANAKNKIEKSENTPPTDASEDGLHHHRLSDMINKVKDLGDDIVHKITSHDDIGEDEIKKTDKTKEKDKSHKTNKAKEKDKSHKADKKEHKKEKHK